MTAPFVPGASVPGLMREDVGGGTFNALRAAAQLGVRCSLFSLRGGDPGGEAVRAALAASGIGDRSAVFLDRSTPTYTAFLSAEGEVIAGLADMELYEIGFPRQLRRLAFREALGESDALLCDANLPETALDLLFRTVLHRPIFAIGISPAKVRRLRGGLPRLRCLFLNRREAEALLGGDPGSAAELANGLAAMGLPAAVVTDGARPVMGYSEGGAFTLEPPVPAAVVDVTGAGDALAGATIAACLSGASLAEAVRHGAAAAMLAVGSLRSAPAFSRRDFDEALAQVSVPITIS